MSWLLRLRMSLVVAAMAILAIVAGNIFDGRVWWLLVAVGLPAIVAFAVRSLSGPVRVAAAVASIGSAVALVVFAVGGSTSDVGDALIAGIQRLLSTDWPSPERPDLIGTIALLLAAPTALAADLAGRRRWHLLALAPVIAAGVTVTALSAPTGARLGWILPVGLIAAVFATLRPPPTGDTGLRDQWTLLRGERRLVPVIAIAGVAAAALSVPTVLADRADPRRNEPAEQTAPLLDPIEATLALRALDPAIDLYRATTRAGDALPGRWRTAALSNYDGQRWTPALTLRPIGRRLAPDAVDMMSFDLLFLDDDLTLVPLPGSPVTIEAPVDTDADRTVVRLSDRRAIDDSVAVATAPSATTGDALTNGIATRAIDDSVSSLTEFAEGLAGDGTLLEQLRRIESTMREDWVLASNSPGGGLQQALVDRFIRETRRGTAEQFATAYVLLARSLGVDARVATGFILDEPFNGSNVTLSSSEAAVWPEVRLLNGTWLAFDPVPPDEASDTAPPPEEPAVQTPAAAQPPIAPPPEPTSDPQDDDETADDAAVMSESLVVRWARRASLALAAIVLPLLTLASIIMLVKYRRRRRLLRSGTPAQRITGTWAVATDRLVDAGLTISASSTNGNIAEAGAPLAARANRELARLATLSSAVTFGDPARPDLLVEDAGMCLGQIESSMAAIRTRGERVRWRLSLRSLRRSTRSPIR